MKPFPPPELTWRPDESRLHVYALPRRAANEALMDVISRAQTIVGERFRETNVPVLEEWLHATIRMIAVDAREIGASQRIDFAGALTARLSGLGPVTLTVADLVATDAGVALYFADDRPGGLWHELGMRVQSVVTAIFGQEAASFAPGPAHISLTYCARAIDSAPIHEALAGLRCEGVPFYFDGVELVDVIQDADAHTYSWRCVSRVPLKKSSENLRGELGDIGTVEVPQQNVQFPAEGR